LGSKQSIIRVVGGVVLIIMLLSACTKVQNGEKEPPVAANVLNQRFHTSPAIDSSSEHLSKCWRFVDGKFHDE